MQYCQRFQQEVGQLAEREAGAQQLVDGNTRPDPLWFGPVLVAEKGDQCAQFQHRAVEPLESDFVKTVLEKSLARLRGCFKADVARAVHEVDVEQFRVFVSETEPDTGGIRLAALDGAPTFLEPAMMVVLSG